MSEILTTNEVQRVAQEVAHAYIAQTKGWSMDDYHFEFVRAGEIVVMDVVHKEDLTGLKESNKSVQLYIDVNVRKVIKEMHFQ